MVFPDRKVQHFKAEYLRLAGGDQLPTMALVHALDSEAHIGSRPSLSRVTVEKLLIKEKINQTENLQLALDNGVYADDDQVQFVYDDWARLAENVRCRTEVAKMEFLSTGKMTINENGLKFTVNFGVPSTNTEFTVDLSDPSKDVLSQIQKVIDAAADLGYTITGMVTSGAVLSRLKTNEGISKAIYGGSGAGAMVTNTQLSALFEDLYRFSDIRTNDARYNQEDKTGKKTAKRFYPRDKISFLAAGNGVQNFGVGLWGVTPEERKQGPWTDKSADQYITLTQWEEPDPVAVWSKASGLFIPVTPTPDGLLVAKATLPEA